MPTTRSIKQTRDDLAERRAAAAQRAREQIDILRTASALRRQEAATEALEQLLLRGRLVFDTLADLAIPQPWALDADGAVLGHLLTIEDSVYLAAIDDSRVDGLTLEEAFGLPWADLDERAAWTGVYADALRALADEAEGRLEAQRRREALAKIAGVDGSKT